MLKKPKRIKNFFENFEKERHKQTKKIKPRTRTKTKTTNSIIVYYLFGPQNYGDGAWLHNAWLHSFWDYIL